MECLFYFLMQIRLSSSATYILKIQISSVLDYFFSGTWLQFSWYFVYVSLWILKWGLSLYKSLPDSGLRSSLKEQISSWHLRRKLQGNEKNIKIRLMRHLLSVLLCFPLLSTNVCHSHNVLEDLSFFLISHRISSKSNIHAAVCLKHQIIHKWSTIMITLFCFS